MEVEQRRRTVCVERALYWTRATAARGLEFIQLPKEPDTRIARL